MNIKNIITVIGVMTLINTALVGEQPMENTFPKEKVFKASLDTTYLSKYINRGVYVGDNVIHNNLIVEYNKVYIDFNSYLGTKDKAIFDQEWDVSVGLNVSDVLLSDMSLDAGAKLYSYPKGDIKDTQELYTGVSYSLFGFNTSAYLNYDTDTETTNGTVSIGRNLQLLDRVGWYNKVALGFTDIRDGAKYGYTEVDSSLTLNLNDVMGITGGGSYRWSDDSDIFDINELIGYVTLTLAY